MKKRAKILCLPLLLIFLTSCTESEITPTSSPAVIETKTPSGNGESYGNGYNFNYLCGVDQFGRAFMPSINENQEKQVGIFYFIWGGMESAMHGIYDNTKLLAENPDALWDKKGSAISPTNKFHFWGEPMFGYYKAMDEFVLRRHIEMLTQAGIDFLAIDVTNANTYDPVWRKLLPLLDEYQQQGWDVPKVAFFTNSYSFIVIKRLYENLYKQNFYPNTWYKPDGVHPMIIGNKTVEDEKAEAATRSDFKYNPDPLPKEITDYFDIRRSQWPNVPYKEDGFPWTEWTFPQPEHSGIISVSVAQHPQLPFSDSVSINSTNWGRGFINSKNEPDFEKGQNFQRQWNVAFKKDPETVFVTGWNEWVAIKLIIEAGTARERIGFVDNFNEEYSRDIEPMKGGYEDAFYLQMISNIKKFKVTDDKPMAPLHKTIDISAASGQWEDVPNKYMNVSQTAYGRDYKAVDGKLQYKLPVPRNNIQEVKVTNDDSNVYFMIRTEKDITAYDNSTNWMNLFIGVGETKAQGWESYNYVINRSVSGNKSSIEALNADGTSQQTREAAISVQGQFMQIAIPKSAIQADTAGGIYFKVADGVADPTHIQEYYISGKSMPMGRLSYYYYF